MDLSKQIPAIAELVAASVPKYVELHFELTQNAFIAQTWASYSSLS